MHGLRFFDLRVGATPTLIPFEPPRSPLPSPSAAVVLCGLDGHTTISSHRMRFKTKLNDDSTIVAIAAVALAALALLITAMKLLHTSIAKVMRDTVSSRSGQSYLGGTRALFGKKGTKGDTSDEC